jgi:hypothetical protein
MTAVLGRAVSLDADAVSRAAPDGSTLLIHSDSFLIDPLVQKANYHPRASFEPICNLVDAPTVITVNSASEARRQGKYHNITFVPYPGIARAVKPRFGAHAGSCVLSPLGHRRRLSLYRRYPTVAESGCRITRSTNG